MAAVIEIDEFNGAGATATHNISNSNMGSTDAVNLDAVANPVLPGSNTFEKWQKLHVTSMGTSSAINTLKVWRTSALGANATHKTNVRETSYGGAATFATPKATDSSVATQAMPATEPTGANLGIGGALSGSLTATGTSDYLVHQIQTTGSAVAGSTSTLNLQYSEVA